MDLKLAQVKAEKRGQKMLKKKQKPLEIIASIAEEFGEVVTEVALFEKIGTKVNWQRRADKKLLAKEISQLLINVIALASIYKIDINKAFTDLLNSK